MKTFVLRLWPTPPGEPAPDGPRGILDDVSAGRSSTFHDGEELLALLSCRQTTVHDEKMDGDS